MKKILMALCFVALQYAANGCPVCERNKANALLALTHGAGPDSQWDYVIVIVAIVIAIFTLFYSVKWLIKPNEKNQDHIKLFILNEQ
ncbi:MAG: hypothetical protein ABIU63_02690 [Chitinophagaceae bacterium]